MLYSRIITGIIFFTVLFAQADKVRERSRSIPKKFNDGFTLESVKDQAQFQNQFNSDEVVHIPGYSQRNHYFRDNRSVDDTLAYNLHWGAYFYMMPGDLMMTVFQMPTDGILKGVNVPVYRWGSGEQLQVSIHDVSYPFGSDSIMFDHGYVDGFGWLAGYDDDGDGNITGGGYVWNDSLGVCEGSTMISNATDPLGINDFNVPLSYFPWVGILWGHEPFQGRVTLDPVNNPGIENGGGDNWLHFEDYGSEVDVSSGEWIGIAVYYSGTGGDGSDPEIGFQYASYTDSPWVSTKFYADTCSGTGGENGWYIRSWVFNFQLAIELTGDRAPIFYEIPVLPTTPSTEDVTVVTGISDDNPSGGDAGVASAQILYQLDSLTAMINSVEMTLISGDNEDGIWEGDIPGQTPGTFVYWNLIAVDVNGNVAETEQQSYLIIEVTSNSLFYYNEEYPLWLPYPRLYFYWDSTNFDYWPSSYGPINELLLDYYDIVIEISPGSPIYNNDEVINEWWGGNKTYIVAGDEWLGLRYGWTIDNTIPEGDVARTVLGIDTYYPDINFISEGDQEGISRLMPDSAGILNVLYDFLSDSLFLNYDPDYETGNSNWLDGFDVVDGYTVDMTAYSGVLDSNGNVADDAEIYNVMVHGQAGNGGKSAFLAFDPLALNTTPGYNWIGASSYWNAYHPNCPPDASPLISVYEALQGIVSIEDEIVPPIAFSLEGNYPNPFNPITNIHYELHQDTRVKITIYDVLGREVKKLVSGELVSGYHKTIWDATNDQGKPVSAGVYFYKLEALQKHGGQALQKHGGQAGDFVQTKKMVLLK